LSEQIADRMENQQEPQPQSDQEPPNKPPAQKKGPGRVYELVQERWPEYVLEIIVIIFSITISFALDEWKEKERKQEVEQIYLKGLSDDLKRDRVLLREVMAETQQIVQKARTLVELNSQSDIDKLGYGQVIKDVKFVFKRPRFIAEDATFADLKSTGNMQLITNYRLKSSLFDYYKGYESIDQVETAELQTTNFVIAPVLLKRFPVVGDRALEKKVDILSIINEIEFKNTMYIRQTTREELLRDYQRLYKQADTIQAMLTHQLKK
jgi:hypothetical protein